MENHYRVALGYYMHVVVPETIFPDNRAEWARINAIAQIEAAMHGRGAPIEVLEEFDDPDEYDSILIDGYWVCEGCDERVEPLNPQVKKPLDKED